MAESQRARQCVRAEPQGNRTHYYSVLSWLTLPGFAILVLGELGCCSTGRAFSRTKRLSQVRFDMWMVRECPDCPFARYADDVVIHCRSRSQAEAVVAAVSQRLGGLGLELHPAKTKIVYCKDGSRKGKAEHVSFDFLGYTFRARPVMGRHGLFTGFGPAVSDKALKAATGTARGWHLNRRSGDDLSALAADINPQVAGWINYYGAFYRSRLYRLAMRIDAHLIAWATQKYKRLRGRPDRAWDWLHTVRKREPTLFAHWTISTARPNTRPVGAR